MKKQNETKQNKPQWLTMASLACRLCLFAHLNDLYLTNREDYVTGAFCNLNTKALQYIHYQALSRQGFANPGVEKTISMVPPA